MVKKIIGKSYIYLVLLFLYAPILVLMVYSFTEANEIGQWSGFSFGLYAKLFNDKAIMTALGNTLIIALLSALIATLLGAMGAIGVFYSKRRSRTVVETITNIPVANSEVVMAISLTVMFVFIGRFIFRTSNPLSFWTLLIGHVTLALPFVYLNIKPKLNQMDPSLYEAALDLGYTQRSAIVKVILPSILPGVLSGFLVAFTLSLDDFIITAFTRGSGLLSGAGQIETLSTYVEAKIKRTSVPPALRALTTLIFLIVLIIVISISIHDNRKAKKLTRAGGRR